MHISVQRQKSEEPQDTAQVQHLYSPLTVFEDNGGKQSLDILGNACQGLVRFVRPEGVRLEPG